MTTSNAKRFTYTASFSVPRDDGAAHRVDGRIIIDADNERAAYDSLRRIVAEHFPLAPIGTWSRKV